jgi:hypothetical protein
MAAARSLVGWLDRHEGLRDLALDVWCAIPEGDDPFHDARRALDAALRCHVDLEDARLLPAWAALPDPPPNATAAVYRADHDRLRALLGDLAAAADPAARAARAALLLDVLDHHDRREASALKPGLDAALDPIETRAFLDEAEGAEARLPPRCPPALGRRGPPADDPALAFATDAPLDGILDRVPPVAHPKGPRLRAALAAAVDAARAEPDPRARRLRLLDAWTRWRLLGLLRT